MLGSDSESNFPQVKEPVSKMEEIQDSTTALIKKASKADTKPIEVNIAVDEDKDVKPLEPAEIDSDDSIDQLEEATVNAILSAHASQVNNEEAEDADEAEKLGGTPRPGSQTQDEGGVLKPDGSPQPHLLIASTHIETREGRIILGSVHTRTSLLSHFIASLAMQC